MQRQIHRLFFALRPEAQLLSTIESAVATVRTAATLRGRWQAAEKLHLTLRFLGDFAVADDIVRRAIGAAEGIRFAPFEFALDRVESFPRRFNAPCVLRCSNESAAPLHALARELAGALSTAGLAEHHETRPYVPHVTIAYAECALSEPIVIQPIVWHARDFVLVDSRVGTSVHAEMARWPLRA